MQLTGAQALIKSLEQEGVDTIFGLPGGAILPVYDPILDSSIRHILVRHEQGAGHMAEGYALATGKAGVAMVTSGPGATNIVTPIANAHMDSTPLVVITGQVATASIGSDAFQECDITGITMGITKHNFLIQSAHEIPRAVAAAFYLATTGRPGPVLIDLPKDVSQSTMEWWYPESIEELDLPGYHPEIDVDQHAVARAVELISQSERPVLYVGGGTLKSRAHHDLLVFANAKIIHVDIDKAEFNKVRRADVALQTNVASALQALDAAKASPQNLDVWWKEIRTWQERYPLVYDEPTTEGPLRPQHVIEAIAKKAAPGTIVSAGVGQHQMWASQFWEFEEPGTWVNSGGAGTMGFGVPAAIGAKVGRPDRTVWCIDGDGCFQMTAQELVTARAEGIPIKVAILNNAYLGMVRQWQEMFYEERYSEVYLSADLPDYVKWAEAMGCVGLRATNLKEMHEVIDQANQIHDVPVVIDFRTDSSEKVFPMVAAGASNDDIMVHPLLRGGGQ